ncbi:helix-turn-helix domain-containing protein [Streptomyces lavendofoliae]|uniref:helix-turn-helix domain-containing protein n=1 Tax=Streptomyces lavendofoliae TaxID=67314 RepID=UPI003D90838C
MAARRIGLVPVPGPEVLAEPQLGVPARLLGAEMRKLRRDAGLTIAQVVLRGGATSESFLSRVENGKDNARITHELILDLARFYGVSDPAYLQSLRRRVDAALTGREQWWSGYSSDIVDDTLRDLLNFEGLADSITTFESSYVPGLLQTSAYATAVMRVPYLHGPMDDKRVSQRLKVRRRRQQLLEDREDLEYSAIIDEAVLGRWVGGRAVMREQLRQLYNFAENRDRVHIRIFPARSWEFVNPMTTSMTLFKFSAGGAEDMIYTEAANRGGGWMKNEEDLALYRASLEGLMRNTLDKAGTLLRLEELIEQLVA